MIRLNENNLVPGAHQKHGVYGFSKSGIVPCNSCLFRRQCEHYQEDASCELIAEFQTEKIKELMALPHIKPEDASLVELAVKEMCIQNLILRYTSSVGMFTITKDKKLDVMPVMKIYWYSVNSLARMLDRLGMSPLARKQLQGQGMISSGGIASQLMALDQAEGENE